MADKPTEAELEDIADEGARIVHGMRAGMQVIVIVFPSPLESGDPVVTRAYGIEAQIAKVLRGQAARPLDDLHEKPLPEKGRVN